MSVPGQPATMRAAVINGPADLSIAAVGVPAPGPGQVLVRVEYCGICGTDLHSVLDGWAPPGTIPGHEWSGEVVGLGSDVDRVALGQIVVGGPQRCGSCEWCRSGRPSLCVTDPIRGSGEGHVGAFAEYHRTAADAVHLVPASLSTRTAALAEPLAVALHGLTLAQLREEPATERALVSGAGPLGLLVIAALAERGITDITVSEPTAARRTQALAAGAKTAVAPGDLPAPPAVPTAYSDEGFTVCFETSGTAAAIDTGLGLLRPTGRLVLLGTGSLSVRLDPLRILLHELVITGAFCYDADGFGAALRLLDSGRLPIDALLSPDDVGLDDLLDVMHRLHAGDLSTKVLVRP